MTSKTRQLAKSIALATAFIGAGAFADIQVDTANLADVNFGIICPVGAIVRVPAENTALGYISQRQAAQNISLTSQVIPLVAGIGFGVQATNISGAQLGPVQITVSHPNFPGHTSTQDTWSDTFGVDGITTNFFTFEFPFEMQTGTWTFEASQFGQPLYKVSFEVVPATSVPHLTAVCAGPALTS